jgi:SSS family solute:Na+ symporter
MGTSSLLWILMGAYGLLMWYAAPLVRRTDQFFQGKSREGREVGLGLLVASIVISWIFAKSITNAANLGATYGLVGAAAYAGWYLSIPVAGIVIYRIRTRTGSPSLPAFLTERYGKAATLGFLLVVLVRLLNEVWSNTAVVGAYFGASGSPAYFSAALCFAFLTLLYSLRGGLRSSILTDLLQFGLAVFLLVFVLALVLPAAGPVHLLSSGRWTLAGGVDLLLVAILQSFSYPFHDPVLTDRGFITRPKTMLRGYLAAGAIAAAFILFFGLIGVQGKLVGLEPGQDAPLEVARAFGVAVLASMTILMMVSAGSTLDSTLSSFSKATVVDLGGLDPATGRAAPAHAFIDWLGNRDPISTGRVMMIVVVVLGSLPLFTGAAILKATTISGTMVLGLAPAFLLWSWRPARRFAFHCAFWPGVLLGVLHAANLIPAGWKIGGGAYAALLGANVYGSVLVFGGFGAGAALDAMRGRTGGHGRKAVLAAAVITAAAGGHGITRAH